jgi:hypothetical protein
MIARIILSALALAAASLTPAAAEVVTSSASGFVVKHVVSTPLPAPQAYRQFIEIGEWWGSDHTFSGDSRNLSIRDRVGGCWCEKLKNDGFVRHMEVIYAAPGQMLRFNGGLGPMQEMPVVGTMTVAFEGDGPTTRVTLTYSVGGYAPGGLASLAPIVDGVIGTQMLRYRQRAGERG